MQLGDMMTRLRSQIGNPTLTDVPDAMVIQHLNDSMQDITNRFRFHKARKRCTFETIAGQSGYGMPTDCLVVLRLWDMTNRRKLEKIGDRQFSSQTNQADTVGLQEKYVRYRDYVELYPTPQNDGDVIEVFYKYAQALLASPADEPGIPVVWHIGIVIYAKYLYYLNQGDVPKQQVALESWKIWLADKPTEVDEESVDIDSGVEVVPLSQPVNARQDFNFSD